MPRDQKKHGGELSPRSDQPPKRPAAPADNDALPQFVTPLVSLEHQVGAHVIHALQQDQTVAVLTTVAPGPNGAQCIVSVGLNGERMDQVQDLLSASQAVEEPVPCVGFHCFLPPREKAAGEGESS